MRIFARIVARVALQRLFMTRVAAPPKGVKQCRKNLLVLIFNF